MKKIILTTLIMLFTYQTASAIDITNLVKPKSPQTPKQNTAMGQQGNILYAENEIEKAFELFLSIPANERTSQNWLLMGNILQDQGKDADAVFMYNQAISADENDFKAYYNLGNIYLEEEKPYLAIEQYKKVLKINPEYPYAYYNMGCAYIKLGELRKAKNALISAIELKNTVADFHYNLAYVYKKLNDEKRAKLYLEYYNKIIDNQIK